MSWAGNLVHRGTIGVTKSSSLLIVAVFQYMVLEEGGSEGREGRGEGAKGGGSKEGKWGRTGDGWSEEGEGILKT